jgi:hypothetical protein
MEKTRKIILFSCRKKGQYRENQTEGGGGIEKLRKGVGMGKKMEGKSGKEGEGKVGGG